MKNNKKIKKLQFTKETIARLGEAQLNGLYGGDDVTHTINGATCTCVTFASKREPCID